MNPDCPVIFLPGAGGGAPDLSAFRAGPDDATRFESISYPGWQRYITNGFSAEILIADLAQQIATKVPQGPICIVGMSIGGHFGYAVALYLQARGREIAGFCAIDSEMFTSSAPSAGWISRALGEGLELLRKRRFAELNRFVRSKIWRALLRSTGGGLPNLLRKLSSFGRSPSGTAIDPLFEEELSMRLLIREAAPWVASIDRDPIALKVPSVLLRRCEATRFDPAWRRRCPNIEILEVPGQHHTLFEPENFGALHEAFISATRHWRGGHGANMRGEAIVGR
jgi:thioesterase domain-containing protein